MKLKDAAIILGVLAAFFLCGYIFGRCSGKSPYTTPAKSETGVLFADDLRPVEVNEPGEMLFVDPRTHGFTAINTMTSHSATPSDLQRLTDAPKSQEKTQKPTQTAIQSQIIAVPTPRPIHPGDDTLTLALATVHDWNLERVYSGTLFDNRQSGTLYYAASVQYNTLRRFEYDYRPAPVAVKRDRIRPYLRGNVDTQGMYGVSIGALYKWFGADAGIVRYGPDQYVVSLGVMIVF